MTIFNHATLIDSIIDDYSYIGSKSFIDNTRLGKFCSIAPDVRVGLAGHPTKDVISTYPAFYSSDNSGCAKKIRDDSILHEKTPKTIIGHDVWIGANAIIPGGIEIGTGAIVAAGAVVVKDVAPYSIVGGNPATLIRYRFSEKDIERLLRSEWWNWQIEFIEEHVNYFLNINNLDNLIAKKNKISS